MEARFGEYGLERGGTRAEQSSAYVLVSHQRHELQLRATQELRFGRGADVDIRIAHDPVDLFVSRLAGSLRIVDDTVLVENHSSRGILRLRPPTGPHREIDTKRAELARPYRQFSVDVIGEYGRVYTILVDARRLPLPSAPPVAAGRFSLPTLRGAPVELSPTETRVLLALARPMVSGSGAPRAASTREVADVLGFQLNYVRNVLKSLRDRLTAHGEPDLVGGGTNGEDFREPLARWALRSGAVTPAGIISELGSAP